MEEKRIDWDKAGLPSPTDDELAATQKLNDREAEIAALTDAERLELAKLIVARHPNSLNKPSSSGIWLQVLMYFVPAIAIGFGTFFFKMQQEQKIKDDRRAKIGREAGESLRRDMNSAEPSDFTLAMAGTDRETHRKNMRELRDALLTLAVAYTVNPAYTADVPEFKLPGGKMLTIDMLRFEGLEKAALLGDVDSAATLIKLSGDANQPATATQLLTGDKNWTVLHLAAYTGSSGVVQLLLENGAAPDKALANSDTPHGLAVQRNHLPTAELLKEWIASHSPATP